MCVYIYTYIYTYAYIQHTYKLYVYLQTMLLPGRQTSSMRLLAGALLANAALAGAENFNIQVPQITFPHLYLSLPLSLRV